MMQVNDNSSKQKRREDKLKLLQKNAGLPTNSKNFISIDSANFLDNALIIGKKLMNMDQYEDIAFYLNDILQSIYPGAKVHYFGSRMHGLGSQDSDLDVFVDTGNGFCAYDRSNDVAVTKLNNVHTALKRFNGWRVDRIITANAKVPILSVFNSKVGIQCDISFSTALGHLNSLLLKYFFEMQPICHKFCIFIKRWLKETEFKKIFSTYSLILMGIYFFQRKNLLPSVKDLQDGVIEPLNIGPWLGNFIQKDMKLEKCPENNKKCFQLLIEFFKFAAGFDYEKLIMCPFLGRPVEKALVNTTELENLPRYAKYYLLNPKDNSFRLHKESRIAVMDPIEHRRNVFRDIPADGVQHFKNYCSETARELEKVLNRM